jgi:hypothetical protein
VAAAAAMEANLNNFLEIMAGPRHFAQKYPEGTSIRSTNTPFHDPGIVTAIHHVSATAKEAEFREVGHGR